jgi:hypothetical protein
MLKLCSKLFLGEGSFWIERLPLEMILERQLKNSGVSVGAKLAVEGFKLIGVVENHLGIRLVGLEVEHSQGR